MPRRRFIDKKTATTFSLVHRAQNDPLIHDEDAPSMVFAEKESAQRPRRPTDDDYAYSSAASAFSGTSNYRSKKTKERGDLEDEFGVAFRANEGQAAQHGVFFDDTEYDYMQHMRDLGGAEGPVTWLEVSAAPQKKGKTKLEDALRSMTFNGDDGDSRFDDAQSLGTQGSIAQSLGLPEASEFVRNVSYQEQQDVADEIAGFQPDMDPDLRQVLEALEDEEYVDDDEGIFGELTRDGYEIDKDTYTRLAEQGMFGDGEGELDYDEAGYETDSTVRASSPPSPAPALQVPEGEQAKPPEETQAPPPADPTDGAWIDEFHKFKSATKASKPAVAPPPRSALESSALSALASGPKKKRKGALTSPSTYSMTSSALARTDQQRLLDARFDKIEEQYSADYLNDDESESRFSDALSTASGLSKASRGSMMSSYSRATDSEAPKLMRSDFDSIMDEFLGTYSKAPGKRGRVRRLAPQTGMEQLDEIRNDLGPARVGKRDLSSK